MKGCMQMKEFCEDEGECRHVLLLRYFGETMRERCEDRCDNCRKRRGQKHDPDWPKQVGLSTALLLLLKVVVTGRC